MRFSWPWLLLFAVGLTTFVVGLPAPSIAAVVLQDAFTQAETFTAGPYGFEYGAFTYVFEDVPNFYGSSTAANPNHHNRAITDITFQNAGGVATFDATWRFHIEGLNEEEGFGLTAITFQVDTDTHYTIENELSSSGDASPFQLVELYEEGGGEIPYSYELGRSPYFGDRYGVFQNSLLGTPSGMLTAGKTYTAYGAYALHAFADGGVSDAIGGLRVTLTAADSSAAPEPATLAVWSGVGIALVLIRRRPRANALPRRSFSMVCGLVIGLALASHCSSSQAAIYGGVNFPNGAISFADQVVAFNPPASGPGRPTAPFLNPNLALGVPDYQSSLPDDGYVSLGDGGSIVLQFVDNALTGSGSSALDLWIFEVGPDVEDTYVEISKNGTDWFSVGKVSGATAGVNIDAFGWGIGDQFHYVRLTDDTLRGSQNGPTVGADIDAIGAISTVATPSVPEPTTLLIWSLSSVGLGWFSRRRRTI